MELQQLIDKSNTSLNLFEKELAVAQDEYFAKHGKYFQLLVSPETKVVDGTDSDFVKRNPPHESKPQDTAITFSQKMPFNIEVHEWVGPKDKGYITIASFMTTEGLIYQRVKDTDKNDTGWCLLTNEIWLTD